MPETLWLFVADLRQEGVVGLKPAFVHTIEAVYFIATLGYGVTTRHEASRT